MNPRWNRGAPSEEPLPEHPDYFGRVTEAIEHALGIEWEMREADAELADPSEPARVYGFRRRATRHDAR